MTISRTVKIGIWLVLLLGPWLFNGEQAAGQENLSNPVIDRASWIWGDDSWDVCEFRKELQLEDAPRAAHVLITADNGYELYVNGRLIGFDIGPGSDVWGSLERWDITPHLSAGPNVIGARVISFGGGRGLVAALRVDVEGSDPVEWVTDAAWRISPDSDPADYSQTDYQEDESWASARVLGPMGMQPWGRLTYAGSVGGRRQGAIPARVVARSPDADFDWPGAVVFVDDDCSIYESLHPEAWGVKFRIGWSRAYTQFDLPTPTKIGHRLCVLDSPGPDAKPRTLVDAGTGALGSPSVTFDGKHILFAMAPEGASFFHIYRIPAEGGEPEQLTSGPFHDIDPAELPDGRIVFSSTRLGTFEEYHGAPSRGLFVMHSDGRNIKPITHTPIFDNEPRILADGRIAFVRSDNFFSRAKVETQIHAINTDGTAGQTIFGSDVGAVYGHRLRELGYGSPAPLPDGRVAVISLHGNFIAGPGDAEASFRWLPGNLGDLAAMPDGRLLTTLLGHLQADQRSRVMAVLDPDTNDIVRIYESESPIHSPVFVGERPRPPIGFSSIDETMVGDPAATGFVYSQNVRFTRKTLADWDQIRAIRVLRSRALSTRSSHWDFVHQGKEVIELGTVPIAPDGSFYVEVPADVPLAFQAVDAEGRAELNEMSWIYVRPGEVRSCVGCHEDRRATPIANRGHLSEALRSPPLRLLGQGERHRWRGNNPGVSGMMDVQFERFRELASLNRHLDGPGVLLSGRDEVDIWVRQLGSPDAEARTAAACRLALFRDQRAAPALVEALEDESREVRTAVVLALSACGTRESIVSLIDRLLDSDANVAQAAAVALENLTAHDEPVSLPATRMERQRQAEAWRAWLETHWPTREATLVEQLHDGDRTARRRAVVALGHIGGDAARAALRAYVASEKDANPYPRFVNNNRTDHFTFDAASPLNPRTLQAATRALGHLRDTEAVPLLKQILSENINPENGNLFLAEAAAEALGWIGTPEAEAILVDTFARLGCHADYVGWYSDHPALYACHASPVHARVIEALDRIASTHAGPIVPHLIRSVPTDPDRALFLETDSYELLVGRVIRRSGRGEEVIAACLAVLGDPDATASDDLRDALGNTVNSWAGRPSAENRAAQILASLCRDTRHEPAVRAAYERYRAMPEELVDRRLGAELLFEVNMPQRHWVLFFLGRALGNLGDSASVDTLLASLTPELNEARHGRPHPADPNVHLLQLEPTPCWRGAAAWALGRIGDRRAASVLIDVVENMDNAVDTRYAAVRALEDIADPANVPELLRLAEDYPEVATRRALLEAAAAELSIVQKRARLLP